MLSVSNAVSESSPTAGKVCKKRMQQILTASTRGLSCSLSLAVDEWRLAQPASHVTSWFGSELAIEAGLCCIGQIVQLVSQLQADRSRTIPKQR